MFKIFERFKDRKRRDTAVMLYNQAVIQGRQPGFYYDWQVPDTFDGRFDMIVAHVILLFRRLKSEHGQLAQALYDVMTQDLEANLRSQGVGDEGILHRGRKYTKGIYARMTAYSEALDAADMDKLADALRKSVYRPIVDDEEAAEPCRLMARYLMDEATSLESQDITDGGPKFGPVPAKEDAQ